LWDELKMIFEAPKKGGGALKNHLRIEKQLG